MIKRTAVVRREGDDCVVQHALLLQCRHDATHLVREQRASLVCVLDVGGQVENSVSRARACSSMVAICATETCHE